MDQAKVVFLFGEPPDGFDPDDPDARSARFSELYEDDDEMTYARLALYEVVANQVADDDPPEVWRTAQRLLGLGLDRQEVLGQLVMAMMPQITAALTDHEPYDSVAHTAALAALPVPGGDEVSAIVKSVVQERQPVTVQDLLALTAAALEIPAQQEPHREFMGHVLDQEIEDEELALVRSQFVVEPSTFCARAVLTHRLTEAELDGGYIETEVDLVGSEQAEEVRGPGGVELEDFWREEVGLAWKGPAGWLAPFPAGTVFAVTTDEGGTAAFVEALAIPPAVDAAAAAAVRAAYDECNEGTGLPVPMKELVLNLLIKDRHFFDRPRPPMRELIEAAGLERRDNEVAHTAEIWRRADELDQYDRVIARFEDPEDADLALSVLRLFNEGDWSDATRLREALVALRDDPDSAEIVGDELLGPELEESAAISAQAALASRFAERLLAVARKPAEAAVARWLMALADERAGDVFGAEAQLRVAVDTFDDWEPAVDRLAWYLSDKGEAGEASRLWRSLGVDEKDARLSDLKTAAGPAISVPGRNEPCWCGSGRKYKTCHVGKPALAPLSDRVRWLAGKSVNYLKRLGPRAALDIFTIATARADGDTRPEAIARAFSDPLTLDLVLNEGGWFEKFLEDRGPLLPSDEAILAESWTLVDRSVYEFLSVRPGVGITVQDLRTGEEIEVRERTLSKVTSAGLLMCARVVPDGQGHQFLGGSFAVRPGTEAELLDLLDEGEPEAIASWAAALDRPPVLRTRENEPSVACKAVIEVPN
ncbi:MAG TPA: SEC-C domain-containing protein, partial [Acidimicrobiales bacterium]|nr:SEC-C domain-containing protein [Acidimicrobiales bacterium]